MSIKEDFWDNKDKADQYVHRSDPKRIGNFNKNQSTYYHNKGWAQSGQTPFKGATKGSKVTFAARKTLATAYLSTRNFETNQNDAPGGSTPQGQRKIQTKGQNPKVGIISSFKKDKFKQLASGEHVSSNPGVPDRQRLVNVASELKNRGYKSIGNPSLKGATKRTMGGTMTGIKESEHLMYRASTKHLRTYLNFMKMRTAQGLTTPADEEMVKKAQKHYSTRLLHNVLTSKNIKEEIVNEDAPTNVAGSGGVAGIGISSPTIKNPPQAEPGVREKKRILKRFAGYFKKA